MNISFGRVFKNKFEYAPDVLDINGSTVICPIDPIYRANGWYYINTPRPAEKTGYKIEVDTWKLNHLNKTMDLTYKYVRTSLTRKISKIYLKIVLAKYGMLETFINWLKSVNIDLGGNASINAFDAFETCLVIDEGDPLFAPYIKQAKMAFGLSDEMYENIISQCVANE